MSFHSFNNRLSQVNALIKKELSNILLKELDLPSNVLITLTRVETLKNLSEAKIYVSVIPEEKREEVFKVIIGNIYNLQQHLNNRLKMRPVPKIRFEKENKTKEAAKIEEILEQLKKS